MFHSLSPSATTHVRLTDATEDRDEFGPLDGAVGLFQASSVPAGLDAREDLGHALCAWLPREHRL